MTTTGHFEYAHIVPAVNGDVMELAAMLEHTYGVAYRVDLIRNWECKTLENKARPGSYVRTVGAVFWDNNGTNKAACPLVGATHSDVATVLAGAPLVVSKIGTPYADRHAQYVTGEHPARFHAYDRYMFISVKVDEGSALMELSAVAGDFEEWGRELTASARKCERDACE